MPRLPLDALIVQAAMKRGKFPRQFRAEPEDDQAQMMAFDVVTATFEAYRWEFRKKKGDKGGKYGKEKNPYYQLLRGMGMAEPRPGI